MAYRPQDTQERILHRLKIARGHLEKVIRMVENDEYCVDILHQSQAIQSALKNVDTLVLENHLQGCVVKDIQKGNVKKTVDEIMKLFKKI